MSINRLTLLQQASTPAGEPEAPDDLQWLVDMLREVMTAVAREEGDILKKAGMIARLSGLLLKASGAAELKQAHKELARHCAELEERLTVLEARAGEAPAPSKPVPPTPEESPQPADQLATPFALVVPPHASLRASVLTASDALDPLVVGAPSVRARDHPAV